MKQEDTAKVLGISQGYFSKIFNGYKKPSWEKVEEWKPILGRSYDWWKKAPLSQIQKLLNRIGGNGNGKR